ncbi:hypothetical protein FFI89_032475 [Bradyrhizobium sp. KBS0727]|jgi:hypothetical protein|uniref:hypothetical protein n=1 Tax=unclassified Bradyrhizobium TaxID=2631580 RepID=UPI00110E9A76|nr:MULTISPECIES: hypothetical protein [unclassified Bradyrhizobium]QDW41425.1 hypothetical protein FFI71_032480 [Bradyrhizobium sp. KBS0725]QDW48031.1 hypothetical protein FFI89_032475 [Bradyrhizobium sp. KBS0727]
MSKDHDEASHGSQDARRHKLDHQTRNQWLDKDAGLQAAWRASSMTRDDFIRHNEDLIDKVITDNLG